MSVRRCLVLSVALSHCHKVPPQKLIYFMTEIMPFGGVGRGCREGGFHHCVLNICLAVLDRHSVSIFRVADCGLGDG